ncbi:uncharacterized protein E0L32_004223 [Thyridium curvatum]|uniref:Uncharacterized protein n=1 Tax=Thyridium curvatum TaxID=1093900 RepID=A0A507BHS9_9PEZI|nr:uncharacterized protein E0L32_004223 [Thyridium curvatum]TPX16228.1 hypothetical protein E0L32_004223 [Thyridium curvatum]
MSSNPNQAGDGDAPNDGPARDAAPPQSDPQAVDLILRKLDEIKFGADLNARRLNDLKDHVELLTRKLEDIRGGFKLSRRSLRTALRASTNTILLELQRLGHSGPSGPAEPAEPAEPVERAAFVAVQCLEGRGFWVEIFALVFLNFVTVILTLWLLVQFGPGRDFVRGLCH